MVFGHVQRYATAFVSKRTFTTKEIITDEKTPLQLLYRRQIKQTSGINLLQCDSQTSLEHKNHTCMPTLSSYVTWHSEETS